MKTKGRQNYIVTGWHDLAKRLSHLQTQRVWACRGEGSRFETLLPSLDRLLRNRRPTLGRRLFLERVLIDRFVQAAPLYLSNVETAYLADAVGTVCLMRHYGAPTRLVDWTSSVWIAAFFAASRDPGKNGYIRMFDRRRLEAGAGKGYPAETSLAVKSDERGWALLDSDRVRTLGEWVVPLYSFGPKFPRIIAQQSFFTIASKPGLDHWRLIGSLASETITIGIPAKDKPVILQGLDCMGINAQTMYPGLDGISMSLGAFVEYHHLDLAFTSTATRNSALTMSAMPANSAVTMTSRGRKRIRR